MAPVQAVKGTVCSPYEGFIWKYSDSESKLHKSVFLNNNIQRMKIWTKYWKKNLKDNMRG